jgi:hypothetical protein
VPCESLRAGTPSSSTCQIPKASLSPAHILLVQVKDKLIAQGAWPGSGGPRVNTEEEDFKVGSSEREGGRVEGGREGGREGVARACPMLMAWRRMRRFWQGPTAGVIAVEGNATALCSAERPAKLLQ